MHQRYGSGGQSKFEIDRMIDEIVAEEGRNSGQLWTKKDNREEAAGLAEGIKLSQLPLLLLLIYKGIALCNVYKCHVLSSGSS